VTIYLVIPLLLLVAIVQTSFVPYFTLWGVFADLPVLIVVSWGLLAGAREGALWGFIAGVATDVLSGAPFGAGTLALMSASLLSGLGEANVSRAQFALPLVIMFLATVLYNLVFLFIVRVTGQQVLWLESLLHIVLPSAALNMILVPLVYGPMRLLHSRFIREEMEF
jgi:rod shape-determining protein MreD